MSNKNEGYKPSTQGNVSKGYQPSIQPAKPQSGHQPGTGSRPAVPTTGSGVKPPSKQ